MVVVVGLRRCRLWWAGTRSVHALCRASNTVAGLLYGGGTAWACRSGCCRCRGRCDCDDVPNAGIAVHPHGLNDFGVFVESVVEAQGYYGSVRFVV